MLGKRKNFLISLFFIIAGIFLFSFFARASNTDGAIDTASKYAWGSKIGWINFGATTGNIHITDSAITGSAWNDLYGWIKLDPAMSGVTNDGAGNLSGYGWNANLGWVDFSGVIINVNGLFTGQASGTNYGVINFDCDHCSVKTDWRPASARAVPAPGGTAMPITVAQPPSAEITPVVPTSTVVTSAPITPPIVETGRAPSPAVRPVVRGGIVGAVVKVKDELSALLAKLLKVHAPAFSLPSIPLAKFWDGLRLRIPSLFAPKQMPSAPIETYVAKETPPSMRGKWEILDPKSARKYVFAPLPKEFTKLAQKIPEINKLFEETGINRLSNLERLNTVKINIPGLTKALGLAPVALDSGAIGQAKTIPIERLPTFVKEKIPSDMIFVRSGGQLIDFKVALSLSEKGRPQQKINTISGKPLHLSIRPGQPVKKVRGFLVFRSKKPQARAEMPFKNLLSSILSVEPAFAYDQEKPVEVEERLVLTEFEYTDPDGDGIYTADIQSPVPAGEYEIITVIDYEDPEVGVKELRLITVVDPEGYIYEKIGNNELRVTGAKTTLYYFNTVSQHYEQWPATEYQQENPQVTDVRGVYSFLVPGGSYYLKVEAPGYLPYQSELFKVDEGGGVHMNVELKPKYWWLKMLDWKTALLLILAIFLAYNFYKDRKRGKREIEK